MIIWLTAFQSRSFPSLVNPKFALPLQFEIQLKQLILKVLLQGQRLVPYQRGPAALVSWPNQNSVEYGLVVVDSLHKVDDLLGHLGQSLGRKQYPLGYSWLLICSGWPSFFLSRYMFRISPMTSDFWWLHSYSGLVAVGVHVYQALEDFLVGEVLWLLCFCACKIETHQVGLEFWCRKPAQLPFYIKSLRIILQNIMPIGACDQNNLVYCNDQDMERVHSWWRRTESNGVAPRNAIEGSAELWSLTATYRMASLTER